MYIHNDDGCAHVTLENNKDFSVASRKGLTITITPAVALTTDFFSLCGYCCSVEESDKNTVLILKDEKQYGGDFTSCLDRQWKQSNMTVVSSIEVTLFCVTGLDSIKCNDLLCSMVHSLRKSHPLIFCPVQRSILSDIEVHCKNISESFCLLDIDVSVEEIWSGILARQKQLLLQLSERVWLGREVQGRKISSVFSFVEDDSDLTQDESFEMTDPGEYQEQKMDQVSEKMSLLTISNHSNHSSDILSEESNESMTLLEEFDDKSFDSEGLLVEHTFDTFVAFSDSD